MVRFCHIQFDKEQKLLNLKDLPFFLWAMLFSSQWKNIVSDMKKQYPEEESNIQKVLLLINKMQETLYKFTNQKLQIYLGIPELAFLLKNYLRKKDNQEMPS